MKKIFLFVFGYSFLLFADPGIGIVQDSKGNIFYTDLKQVWKISVEGKKTIAVPNVHTHELYIDANDNLFGEHLWYNGERLNTWGHYVWKYSARGTIEHVIPTTAGFLTNYSFVRDKSGAMYWIDRTNPQRIKKKSGDGKISFHSNSVFTEIGRLHCTDNGDIYFIDNGNVIHISPDEHVRIVASKIHKRTARSPHLSDKHSILGIWSDKNDNIYIAVTAAQHVKKISSNGEITVVATSSGDWSPTSGILDKNGVLWLMEYNRSNDVQIRRIHSATSETIF